jgi:hypothetical protein
MVSSKVQKFPEKFLPEICTGRVPRTMPPFSNLRWGGSQAVRHLAHLVLVRHSDTYLGLVHEGFKSKAIPPLSPG